MAYIESKNIKIYPSAYRGQINNNGSIYNPESYLNCEYNLTKLANRSSSNDAFIKSIYSEIDQTNSTYVSYIEFNIHGYWFKVPLIELSGYETTDGSIYTYNTDKGIFGKEANIYAYIKLRTLNAGGTVDTNNVEYEAITLLPYESQTSTQDHILDYYDSNTGKDLFVGLKLVEEVPSDYPGYGKTDSEGYYCYGLQLWDKDTHWAPLNNFFINFSDKVGNINNPTKSIAESFSSNEILTPSLKIGNPDNDKVSEIKTYETSDGNQHLQINDTEFKIGKTILNTTSETDIKISFPNSSTSDTTVIPLAHYDNETKTLYLDI